MTNSSSPREELAEALKGLTFKFEVRIIDVEMKPTTETRPIAEPPRQVHEPSKEARFESEAMKPQNDKPVNGWSQRSTAPEMDHLEVMQPKKEPQVVEPVLAQPQAEIEPDTKPVNNDLKVKSPFMIPSVLTRKHQLMEKPKQQAKIIRGQLSSQQRTCCMTVVSPEYPAVAYVAYDSKRLLEVTDLLTEAAEELEAQSALKSVSVGDIVFAKSMEDNTWYRSMVTKVISTDCVEVDFFDWGLREELELSRLRRMNDVNLGFSSHPACAVKVKFTNQPGLLLDEVLKSESEFNIQVNSYDAKEEIHSVTILSLVDA